MVEEGGGQYGNAVATAFSGELMARLRFSSSSSYSSSSSFSPRRWRRYLFDFFFLLFKIFLFLFVWIFPRPKKGETTLSADYAKLTDQVDGEDEEEEGGREG